jgi:hypothetical protein
MKIKNWDSQNFNVYRGYHGNYKYNSSHCFSLELGSEFDHQTAAPHLPTDLPC